MSAPRRLSLPSFLTSDIGTCMRKKTASKHGERDRERERDSTEDAPYAATIKHFSQDTTRAGDMLVVAKHGRDQRLRLCHTSNTLCCFTHVGQHGGNSRRNLTTQ